MPAAVTKAITARFKTMSFKGDTYSSVYASALFKITLFLPKNI